MERKSRIKKLHKPPEPTEFQIQCNIFSWARVMEYEYPELKLLVASMNGAWIPNADPKIKGTGVITQFKWRTIALLKKCGCLRPGWPDIQLPVSRGGYHGLFIELKRDNGGDLSQEQKDMIRELFRHGHYACVCHGEAATKRIILSYLEGELRAE